MHLSDLDLAPNVAFALDRILGRSHGLVVICGPAGAGKTTTSETLRAQVAHNRVSVDLAGLATGFHATTSTVVLAGDLRSPDDAVRACELAASALVIATMRSGRSSGVLDRLKDMGVPDDVLALAHPAVLTQQLCRRLCRSCRTPHIVSSEALMAVGITEADLALTSSFVYAPGSCGACTEGYDGHVALFEVLLTKSDWRPSEQETGIEIVTTLAQDAVLKLVAGLTGFGEIQRVMG
jgi:general secretion pathway protein E